MTIFCVTKIAVEQLERLHFHGVAKFSRCARAYRDRFEGSRLLDEIKLETSDSAAAVPMDWCDGVDGMPGEAGRDKILSARCIRY